MDTETAKLLVESLLDRIERDPESGKARLDGPISNLEIEALEFFRAKMEGDFVRSQLPVISEKSVPSIFHEIELEKIDLNLDSLERGKPENDYVILCLDFGTAMSKAFGTNGTDHDLVHLALGQRASEPNMVYPVSSTLYISRHNKIHFGYNAVIESLTEEATGRQRFDSTKQYLSQGLEQNLKKIVDKEINPTKYEFSTGDLLTLYLSFLTDLACTELEKRNLSRYTLRRFARPRWNEDRAAWADLLMKKMLAKAQILADTFSESWTEGIDVKALRSALDEVNVLERKGELPEYLIDEGVHEAIAAASGSLARETGNRDTYMVVDVGAGTTDFGLFTVISRKGSDDRPKVFEIPNTSKVWRQAGDKIDKILLNYILNQENIVRGDSEYDHVYSDLRLRIRELKETLFREGVVEYTLENDSEGLIDEGSFLKDSQMLEFSKILKEYFVDSLNGAASSRVEEFGDHRLTVVLTGGGASLPMVRELGKGQVEFHDKKLTCVLAQSAPEWLVERYPELELEYPQLAVAIGGAADELPEEGGLHESSGGTNVRYVGVETSYKGS